MRVVRLGFAEVTQLGQLHVPAEGLHRSDPSQHPQLRSGHHPQGPDPAGDATNFNYTKAFATDPASGNTFQLNGAAGTNSKTFDGVLFGAGTVEETLPLPGAWEFVSLDCSASSGVTVTINGRVASWTIDNQSDVVDCTYTNKLRQGAILVTKTRKHAAAGGSAPHAGVSFTVGGVTKQTDANGQACFDGLSFATAGTSYDVVGVLSRPVTMPRQGSPRPCS